jgi:hypothetical protein
MTVTPMTAMVGISALLWRSFSVKVGWLLECFST